MAQIPAGGVQLVGVVAYETPHAPSAGITAVIRHSLGPLVAATGRPTIVLTPYHRVTKDIPLTKIGSISVPYDDEPISVEVLQHESYVFLKSRDPRFFAGRRHPYDLPESDLVRDALFFGAAVARALPIIATHFECKAEAPWAMFLHDWEAATVALALANEPRHNYVLVLHNVYDGAVSGLGLTPDLLEAVGIDPDSCPGPEGADAATVLQRALSLLTLNAEVFAVSDQFAADIVSDPYLSEVLAPHLREELRPRLRGNSNGLFEKLQVPTAVFDPAARGDYAPLRDWKRHSKATFGTALRQFEPSNDRPLWGDRAAFLVGETAETVWFITGGRDDARQRGHDVLAAAVPECVAAHPEARFLFFVIPGEEGPSGLAFLQRLAETHPGRVLVLPFIFREGYFDAMRGADWAVMPSLYGPFESANEFYMFGVPAVGRATGGMLQQVIPLRAAGCFGRAVQVRADRWHSMSATPTGLLYRERDEIPDALADWQAINATGGPDRVAARSALPVFRAMARELSVALGDAVRLSREQPDGHCRMIVEGIQYLQRTLSWERNAQEYVRLL